MGLSPALVLALLLPLALGLAFDPFKHHPADPANPPSPTNRISPFTSGSTFLPEPEHDFSSLSSPSNSSYPPLQGAFIGLYNNSYNALTSLAAAFPSNASLAKWSLSLSNPSISNSLYSMDFGDYDSYTGIFCYSLYEKGAALICVDTITGNTNVAVLPCSPSCNYIINFQAYNGTINGYAAAYGNPYNYTISSVYFFSFNILTQDFSNTFWVSIPLPYYLYMGQTEITFKVVNNTTVAAYFFAAITSYNPNVINAAFAIANFSSKTLTIQPYVNTTRFCGEKMIFDYSDNSIWCLDSFGFSHLDISNLPKIGYQNWWLPFPTYSVSRMWSSSIDLVNRVYYTLAGNDGFALKLVSYDMDTNQVTAQPNSWAYSLWFINLVGPATPCYGCVYGTCNQTTNYCQCQAGYTGSHCQNGGANKVHIVSA